MYWPDPRRVLSLQRKKDFLAAAPRGWRAAAKFQRTRATCPHHPCHDGSFIHEPNTDTVQLRDPASRSGLRRRCEQRGPRTRTSEPRPSRRGRSAERWRCRARARGEVKADHFGKRYSSADYACRSNLGTCVCWCCLQLPNGSEWALQPSAASVGLLDSSNHSPGSSIDRHPAAAVSC